MNSKRDVESRGDAKADALTARGHRIRPLNPDSAEEIELVATRMRLTLMEVLGEETGGSYYTMDWLRERVRWHLDPASSKARILLAVDGGGHMAGHTIVRVEREESGRVFGLFATTFVEPESRQQAMADHLLLAGEAWMKTQGLTVAATDTSRKNTPLIQLYRKHGYEIIETADDMIGWAVHSSDRAAPSVTRRSPPRLRSPRECRKAIAPCPPPSAHGRRAADRKA